MHSLQKKDEERKMQGYRYKDFMPMVWAVLVLYLLGWVPGFIANLGALTVVLFSRYDEQQGRGCLLTLFLIVGCGVPIVLFLLSQVVMQALMQSMSPAGQMP
jgi:hypothetical protein